MADALVSCIATTTNCKITLEQPVLMGDLFQGMAANVSPKTIPDYSVWKVTGGFSFNLKLFYTEVKTIQTLQLKSICQTIGYYMASSTELTSSVSPKHSPLAILQSQSAAYLIFFPYTSNDVPCMDAVVVGAFDLNRESIESIVTLIVRYIRNLPKSQCITSSTLNLHKKEEYVNIYIQSVSEEDEQKARKKIYWQLVEENQRKDEEIERKDEEIERKDEEIKRKDEEIRELKQHLEEEGSRSKKRRTEV